MAIKVGKIRSEARFSALADFYHDQYGKTAKDIDEKYPANRIRLDIFKILLDDLKPKTILDVGCGSGMPMIELLKMGFDVEGFDSSEEMIKNARLNLQRHNLNPDRVFQSDILVKSSMPKKKFDCITGMGVIPYLKNLKLGFDNLRQCLKRNGDIIYSLRNELFSMFSMNNYTFDFVTKRLIELKNCPDKLRKPVIKFYQERFADPFTKSEDNTLLKIDDRGIFSWYHNPLEMKDFCEEHGLVHQDLYYYHYHALPPVFEHLDKKLFRELSLKLEKPSDWRGMLLCSTFICHAKKEE